MSTESVTKRLSMSIITFHGPGSTRVEHLILLVEILRTLTTSGLVYNRPNASGKLQYTPKSGEFRVMSFKDPTKGGRDERGCSDKYN